MIDVLIVTTSFFSNKAPDPYSSHLQSPPGEQTDHPYQAIVLPERSGRRGRALLNRFKWGLSADLQAPDFETQVAILEEDATDGVELLMMCG